jgi:RNA polymerase sigma-70 factor (ECF subfamily)
MASSSDSKINKELLSRLKLGDEAAFDAIYWTYNAWVFNFIHALLHDKETAEDLTQNVFLKIWERRMDVNPELSFEAYIFTIARNQINKETKNRIIEELFHQSLEKQALPADFSNEQVMDTDLLREYINRLIERLPAARKNIYKLSREKHLSNKEIAQMLSISERTVETQIYRSLQFLKKELSSDINISILLLFILC